MRQVGYRLGQEFEPLRGQLDLLKENTGDVALGSRETPDEAKGDRIVIDREHDDRQGSGRRHRRFEDDLRPDGVDRVDPATHELRRHRQRAVDISAAELHVVDLQVAALLVAEQLQLLHECTLRGRRRCREENAEAKDFRRLAGRPRRGRPQHCRAQKQRKDTSAVHSMTSSARSRIVGGIVRPSSRAVFKLTTSSNLVGCSIGRSAGLAPLRILSTSAAARSKFSRRSAP